MGRRLLLLWMLGASLACGEDQARLRRPVDAVWLEPGEVALIANSRSGSFSVVDRAQAKVVAELDVGGQLVDLHPLASPDRCVAVDATGNRLLWIEATPHGVLRLAGQQPVGRGPLTVLRLSDSTLAVACRWDRALERLTLEADTWPPRLLQRQALSLPFAPRLLLELPGGTHLVVTDNHADQLAVIDRATWTIHSIRRVQGHNIRGLVLSPDQHSILLAQQIFLLAQQILNETVATSQQAVRDGILMQNVVRSIPVSALVDRRAVLPTVTQTFFLGRASEGAADPSGLAIDSLGTLCITLGGVHEIEFMTASGNEKQRTPVGIRPTAVIPVPDRPEVLVINSFSDSVSFVNSQTGKVTAEISLGATPPLGPADRGELLFHEARLSLENWMSCHSCHTDGHANGALTDTLGDNSRGTPKRVLTLLGGRDANPWGWSGSVRELHSQVVQSIDSTMQGAPRRATEINDLVAYMHTLEPAPPLLPVTDEPTDRALWRTGEKLFHKAGCAQCHIPPLTYTNDGVFDVGLSDEAGLRKFNPPSLRGVSQRDSFFHDGQTRTLEAVLESGHFTTLPLDEAQRAALVRYLKSL